MERLSYLTLYNDNKPFMNVVRLTVMKKMFEETASDGFTHLNQTQGQVQAFENLMKLISKVNHK